MGAGDNRIDGILGSLAVKAPCQAVAIINITLSGEQTVNGIAVVTNDRVLVTAQTSSIDNGVYDVRTTAWKRSPDMDGNRDLTNGTLVVVVDSPIVGFYQLTATNPVVVGTTALTFGVIANLTLAGDLASVANGDGASMIGIEDVAGNYTATDVEAALAESFEARENGSFTLNFGTGFTTTPSVIVDYVRAGDIVVLAFNGTLSATSDTTGLVPDGTPLPASLRPITGSSMLFVVKDNGVDQIGMCRVQSNGSMNFFVGLAVGGTFTNSGLKGWDADNYHITYMLQAGT